MHFRKNLNKWIKINENICIYYTKILSFSLFNIFHKFNYFYILILNNEEFVYNRHRIMLLIWKIIWKNAFSYWRVQPCSEYLRYEILLAQLLIRKEIYWNRPKGPNLLKKCFKKYLKIPFNLFKNHLFKCTYTHTINKSNSWTINYKMAI